VTQIYNTLVGKYQHRYLKEDQIFELTFPLGADPDTCPWPIQPHRGWTVVTQFDGQVYLMNKEIYVPGMQGAKMIRKIGKDGKLIASAKKKAQNFSMTGSRFKEGRECLGIDDDNDDLKGNPVPVCRQMPVYDTAFVNYHSGPAPMHPQAMPTLLGHGGRYSTYVSAAKYGYSGC